MPGAAPGEPRTLGDLGLRLNRDGSFALDNAQLDRALTETPRAVSAMFTTGVFGVFATMDRLVRNATRVNDPGSLGGSLTRLQRQMQNTSERLDKIADQQERLREQLTRQFSASERRVNNSQTTLAFLQQQIDVWTAPQR
jgi:flagellar hook-associated protein 2